MTTLTATDPVTLASAVGEAVAAVVPAAEPLTCDMPQFGDPFVVAEYAGAVLVELEGAVSGKVVLLVDEALVSALSGTPIGDLDLASAVQPALDAAAAALGANAGPATSLGVDQVPAELGSAFTLVPLMGAASIPAAVLVPDTTLQAALAAAAASASASAS